MPNLSYLWLAARLKLLPSDLQKKAVFVGVTFSVEPEHYQLRGVLKRRSIEPVLARLLSLCDTETLFVDIGANVGLFSLLIASQTGAKVLALEPVRSTFHSLVNNCALNPDLAVVPLNLALGAEPAVVSMTADPGSGINQVAHLSERDIAITQQAFQLCLDQLRLHALLGQAGRLVLKIDVERYEFDVLDGARQLLALNLPIALCIEVDECEAWRLRQALGEGFYAFNPEMDEDITVLDYPDTTNLFFANRYWFE